jgi:hypothetical protein
MRFKGAPGCGVVFKTVEKSNTRWRASDISVQ